MRDSMVISQSPSTSATSPCKSPARSAENGWKTNIVPQEQEGVRHQVHGAVLLLNRSMRGRMDQLDPRAWSLHGGQAEGFRAAASIEQEQNRLAIQFAAVFVDLLRRLAADQHSQEMIGRISPVGRSHLTAIC